MVFFSHGAICGTIFRTFVPARIRAARETGETFARPRQFSLERRLRDSFGVQSGQGKFNVVVRFNELVADYIREKEMA